MWCGDTAQGHRSRKHYGGFLFREHRPFAAKPWDVRLDFTMQESIPGRKGGTGDAEEPCSEIEECKQASDLNRKWTQEMDLFSFNVLAAVSYLLTMVTDATVCLHDALPRGLNPGSLWCQPGNDQPHGAKAPSIALSKHTVNISKSVSNIGTLIISFITFDPGIIIESKICKSRDLWQSSELTMRFLLRI